MKDQLLNRRNVLRTKCIDQNLRLEKILAQNPKDRDSEELIKVQALLNEFEQEMKSITKILDKSAIA